MAEYIGRERRKRDPQEDIKELKKVVTSLTEEVQSLSQSLTDLMTKMYTVMERRLHEPR